MQNQQDGVQRASIQVNAAADPVSRVPDSANAGGLPPVPRDPPSGPPNRPVPPARRRSGGRRFLLLGVAAVILVGAVGAEVLLATTSYTTTPTGVELGPARQHTASSLDAVARVTKGALDAAAGSAGVSPVQQPTSGPNAEEQALLDLTNQARTAKGLPALTFDPLLLVIARTRADSQLGQGPLSHYDALGQLAFAGLLSEANVPFTDAGENLARIDRAGASAAPTIQQALMNSPTHRANILEPSYKTLAIGEATNPSGRIAFAEIFRAPPTGTASDSPAGLNTATPPPDA